MRKVFLISFVIFPFLLFSQDCKILGKTEPFSFIIIQGSTVNTTSNELGEFELNNLLQLTSQCGASFVFKAHTKLR